MTADSFRFDDLLRAFAALKPADDVARRAIAARLGFYFESPAESTEGPAKPRERVAKRELEKPFKPAQSAPSSRQATPSSVAPAADVATILRSVTRASASPPDWLLTVEPLPLPKASLPPPPRLEPLFQPRWTRGILVAATSISTDSGPIDVGAVVASIARGVPIRSVPRRPVVRMASSVQVLVDASDTMVPFSADQDWLADRIATTAGRDRTQILAIVGGEPFLAGQGALFEWRGYFDGQVPPPGVAVILISDLGLGRAPMTHAASPSAWAAFARQLRRRGCPIVAIVPYPPSRWPAVVRRAMPIVQWDRATTARAARRAVGRSLVKKGSR
jgi:hypothetical protein